MNFLGNDCNNLKIYKLAVVFFPESLGLSPELTPHMSKMWKLCAEMSWSDLELEPVTRPPHHRGAQHPSVHPFTARLLSVVGKKTDAG